MNNLKLAINVIALVIAVGELIQVIKNFKEESE